VLAGFCQEVTKSDDAPQTIRGIVFNKLTGEPISRALVFSRDNRLGALSDGSGRFEFTRPGIENPSDTPIATFGAQMSFQSISIHGTVVNLTAKKPGFLDDAEVASHQDASALNLTISLLAEAIIHGHVLTSNNEPAEAMNLQLFKQEVNEGAYHWIPVGMLFTQDPQGFHKLVPMPTTARLPRCESQKYRQPCKEQEPRTLLAPRADARLHPSSGCSRLSVTTGR
jgi:hypothetical protein